MLVFDAEQLSFKNLDKDNITWVTIKGNHVPIPKRGSKEEKARAIKEWFASKKKTLPAPKPVSSVYSAKFEHDTPKLGASGSGEGAEVHGYGQYTQKNIFLNKKNYFDDFGSKLVVPKDGVEEKPEWNPIEKDVFNSFHLWAGTRGDDILTGYRNYLNAKIKKGENGTTEQKEEAQIASGKLKAYEDMIKTGKIDPKDFVVANKYFLLNDKPVTNKMLSGALTRITSGISTFEKERGDMERAIEAFKGQNKRIAEKALADLNSIKDIDKEVKPAKAQMSRVELPATKYYLKENKSIIGQSGFVKNALKDAIYEYAAIESGVSLEHAKKNPWFDDISRLVDKAINSTESDAKRYFDEFQELQNKIRKEFDKNKAVLGGWESGITKSYWNMNDTERKNYLEHEGEERAKNLTDFVGDIKSALFTHPYKSIGHGLREMVQGEFVYRNGESLYNLFTRTGSSYGNTHADKVRGTNILKRAGVKGVSYYGRADQWSNVTFDPKDVKVIEKTTDPDVIKKWIEEQNKHNGKEDS